LLTPGPGTASPVTYTETATISGSLGGQSFSGDLLTLTGSGDTANVTGSFVNLVSASVSITGVGNGGFTDATQVAAGNRSDVAGFGDPGRNLGILFTLNTAFSTYDLKTSIGPLSGVALFNNGVSFPTTAGAFIINSVTGDATFSAVVSPSGVPLPGALPLFATGLAGLGLLGWRRKRKAAA
jgi:hypothetical protein